MKIPTRLIAYKSDGHQALINVDAFDPAIHVAVDAPTKAAPVAAPPMETAPSAPTMEPVPQAEAEPVDDAKPKKKGKK